MKLEHTLTPCSKINSKWLKDLNLRHDTMKTPGREHRQKLFDINCINVLCQFLKAIETKRNKWNLIKFTSFCAAKETINKTKQKNPAYRIGENDATNKGLISKIHKQFIQLNNKKTNNQKMDRRL